MIRSARKTNVSSNIMKYRFVIFKTKKIIQDSRGELIFIENFDNVMYELFGMKHFCKKLNDCYDDRDLIGVVDQIGLAYLMDLMNNAKMFETLTELVGLNYRITTLQKEIRKQSKKGKRDKDTMKEYNYLTNLYKDACKVMRKRLGVKNARTSYKRKYKSLNDLIHRNDYGFDDEDDDYTSILFRDDFGFSDDDDYDDLDETSELEDFVNRMNGVPPKQNSSRRSRRVYDDEFIDDFDEDDDEDDLEILPRKDKVSSQVDKLTDTVSELAGAVQALYQKEETNTAKSRRQYYEDESILRPKTNPNYAPRYEQPASQPSETAILGDYVQKLAEDQAHMKGTQRVLAEAIDDVRETNGAILKFLEGLDDGDDDDLEVSFGTPEFVSRSGATVDMNKYDDPYETTATAPGPRPGTITREELIDEINSEAGNLDVNEPAEKPAEKNPQ